MANAEGLGVLFTGFIERAIKNSKEAKKILGIDKKEVISCMLIGYPDIKFRRTVPRKQAEIHGNKIKDSDSEVGRDSFLCVTFLLET